MFWYTNTMGLFRSSKSKQVERSSVIISIKMEEKMGLPLESDTAWMLLQEAFKNHPNVVIRQAEIRPDLLSSICPKDVD